MDLTRRRLDRSRHRVTATGRALLKDAVHKRKSDEARMLAAFPVEG